MSCVSSAASNGPLDQVCILVDRARLDIRRVGLVSGETLGQLKAIDVPVPTTVRLGRVRDPVVSRRLVRVTPLSRRVGGRPNGVNK